MARLVGFILVLALLAAACASDPSETSAGGTTSNSTVEPVRVGALYPLSGSAASAGERVLDGVRLAAEVVNGEFPELDPLPLAAATGLPNLANATIGIVPADHASDPATAMAETDRLITEEHVSAIVGAYQSSVTAAGSVEADRLGVPWVTGASSSTALTEDRDLRSFFRPGPSDRTFAAALFTFLQDLAQRDGLTLRDIVILHEDTTFGTDAARVTRELAEAAGFVVVADIEHGDGVPDVELQAQQVISADPDVLFQASYTPEAILFTEAWVAGDYAAPTLAFGAGFADPMFFDAVGTDGDYVITRAAWARGAVDDKPVAEAVAKLFEERFATPMDEDSARAFTAALTLFAAIDEAGSRDPDAIRVALSGIELGPEETIMPWSGIRFDAQGQNELARAVLLQYQDDAYRVVWPFDRAEAELVWPIPAPSERP